jgi:hypothetical protein
MEENTKTTVNIWETMLIVTIGKMTQEERDVLENNIKDKIVKM